jgi:PAS domain S-box-containing protein
MGAPAVEPPAVSPDADELVQTVLDHAPIVVTWFDNEGRLLFANREFERVRGVERGELLGMTRAEFLSPDSAAVLERNDQEVLAGGEPLRFEESTADSTGTHDYLSVKFPLCDQDGVAYAVCSASIDITERRRTEVELARLAAIVAAARDAIISMDLDGRVTSWNDAAEAMLGYSAEEMLGNEVSLMVPEHVHEARASLSDRALAREESALVETQGVHKDGRMIDVAITTFPLFDADGRQTGAAGILHDISDRVLQRRELAASEQRYREILEHAPDGVLRLDVDGCVDYVNARMLEMLGYSAEEMLGRGLLEFVDPERRQIAQQNMAHKRADGGGKTLEGCLRRKDGQPCWVRISTTSLFDAEGSHSGALAIFSDITEAKAQEAELRSSEALVAAVADSMTEGMFAIDGAGCLTYMNRAAEAMLGWSAEEFTGRQMHEVIHSVCKDGSAYPVEECSLERVVETGAPLAVGDDVFVRRGGELLPVAYSSSPLHGGAAGAVVVFRDITESKAEELRMACELEAFTWVGRIRDALEQERFVLYAQPILELSSGAVTQHELLIRMIDPAGEVITPSHFLPTAERHGLIKEIDHWVIDQAARLVGEGYPGSVQFNVSGKSIAHAGLARVIQSASREHGADPERLICEITETALLDNPELGELFVRELNAHGCQVALDDFGTGYGGFTTLKRLPVSYLKIDIEFVRDLADNPASRHVVMAIINLARGFGQKTIAEGVEDERTLELLKEMGVDLAQGYAIGRPAPVDGAARTIDRASSADGLADSIWR